MPSAWLQVTLPDIFTWLQCCPLLPILSLVTRVGWSCRSLILCQLWGNWSANCSFCRFLPLLPLGPCVGLVHSLGNLYLAPYGFPLVVSPPQACPGHHIQHHHGDHADHWSSGLVPIQGPTSCGMVSQGRRLDNALHINSVWVAHGSQVLLINDKQLSKRR